MAIVIFINVVMEVFYYIRWNFIGIGEDIWNYFVIDGILIDEENELLVMEGE